MKTIFCGRKKEVFYMNKVTYQVGGLHCANCEKRVVTAVKAVEGVKSCAASAKKGTLQVSGDFSEAAVKEAVRNLGFEI